MAARLPKQQNIALRSVFNQDAAAYDASRPGYPAQLIEDVISFAQIPAGGRILEVGSGTGQATLPFAQRGYSLTGVDIGAEMLKIAGQKLKSFPNVGFWCGAFEDWPLEPDGFDLFISATAFHWVPRETGYAKAAAALKTGGTLAIFNHEHPQQGRFFEEVQEVYARYHPHWRDLDPREGPDIGDKIRELAGYIDSTHLFTAVSVKTYFWVQPYTTAEYLALLNTYSDMRALEASQRERLLGGIAELIDRSFGGQLIKDIMAVLYLARKV